MKQTLDLQKLTQRRAAIHTLTGQLQRMNAPVSIVVKTETVAHIAKKGFPTCSFLFIVSIFFLYLMSLDLSLLSLNLGAFSKAIPEKI